MKGSFGYGACRRNQNFLASSPVHDGCLEYLSSKDSLRCEVCGCHRNFHEKSNFAADGLDVQFRSDYIENEEQGQNFCKENVQTQNTNRLVSTYDDRGGQGSPQMETFDNKEQGQTSYKDAVLCQKGQIASRNKSGAREENMSGVESGLLHKLYANRSSYQEGNVHGTRNVALPHQSSSKVIDTVPPLEDSLKQVKGVEGSNIVHRIPCKRPEDSNNHDGSFEDTVQKKVRLSRALVDWGSEGSSDSEADSKACSLNSSKEDVKAVHYNDKANVVVSSRSPCMVNLNRAMPSKPKVSNCDSRDKDVKMVHPLNYAHHGGLKSMRGLSQSPANQGPSAPNRPYLFASASDAVVPSKLKRAFEVLQLDHLDDKLELRYVNGEWKVWCGICETDLSVDKPGLTLNNVKQHFVSKKHGVNRAFLSSWTPYR